MTAALTRETPIPRADGCPINGIPDKQRKKPIKNDATFRLFTGANLLSPEFYMDTK